MDPKDLDALLRARHQKDGKSRSLLVQDEDRAPADIPRPRPAMAPAPLTHRDGRWFLGDHALLDGASVEFYLGAPNGWVRGTWESATGSVWFPVTDPLQPSVVVGEAQLAPPEGASGRPYTPGQLPRE